uniref:Uncharacterized protein n=1 Tax=Rhizophora mucronata TaxID=61149 RepID=A0A2P2P6K2_RHIMU
MPDCTGMTKVLMVTSSIRMLYWVHCHLTYRLASSSSSLYTSGRNYQP